VDPKDDLDPVMKVKTTAPPGNQISIIQSIGCHFTDWAIPVSC